jgi:hypothetical protein
MSGYPAYEAHGHRDNGEVFNVAVLGRLPDTDAFALAQKYANRWRALVSLCRVPFVDRGQLVGWFVDEVEIVAQLVPAIEKRRFALLPRQS